jgi:hypothetical protein
LRRIARPLARKGLSVIVAFLLSEFPNFRWDLERRVTPVEIAADRNRSIVAVETQKRRSRPSRRPGPKSAARGNSQCWAE